MEQYELDFQDMLEDEYNIYDIFDVYTDGTYNTALAKIYRDYFLDAEEDIVYYCCDELSFYMEEGDE